MYIYIYIYAMCKNTLTFPGRAAAAEYSQNSQKEKSPGAKFITEIPKFAEIAVCHRARNSQKEKFPGRAAAARRPGRRRAPPGARQTMQLCITISLSLYLSLSLSLSLYIYIYIYIYI